MKPINLTQDPLRHDSNAEYYFKRGGYNRTYLKKEIRRCLRVAKGYRLRLREIEQQPSFTKRETEGEHRFWGFLIREARAGLRLLRKLDKCH